MLVGIGSRWAAVSMSEVFLRLGDPVLARDSALRKSDTESCWSSSDARLPSLEPGSQAW